MGRGGRYFFFEELFRELDFFAEDLREADAFRDDDFVVDCFEDDLRAEDFFAEDFFADDFFADDLRGGGGTLPPSRRASDRPMATACLRDVTFLPEPLLSVPFLRRRIALSTLSCDF